MVVLSAGVCTKTGKSLFSRQYVDLSRGRVEGLLAAFPKLLGTASAAQHTYVETDAVRYVYHPLDQIYVLLITNKHSNIMEDLDTLQLLAKLVPDTCGSASPSNVLDHVFSLLFAFDEVVTSGGYKEDITMRQVKTNMEMNSHEERLAKLIRQSKINEARDVANNKAKMLSHARKEAARMAGGSSSFGANMGITSSYSNDRAPSPPSYTKPKPTTPSAPTSRRPKRGMKLGAKKAAKKTSLLQSVMAEEHIPVGAGAGPAAAVEETKQRGPSVDVNVEMEEKLIVSMSRDGSLNKLQVSGTMAVVCNTEAATRVAIRLERPQGTGFQFQPHPNVSKPAWKNSILTLKDLSRTFPVGTQAGVLRWRYTSKEEGAVPIVFNVWPEEIDMGVMSVNIEYTLQNPALTLNNVTVRIPLPDGEAPDVTACAGANAYDSTESVLTWTIPLVDSSCKNGTLEFTVSSEEESAFFPVQVGFTAAQTMCPVAPVEVDALTEEGETLGTASFHSSRLLSVSRYKIEDA